MDISRRDYLLGRNLDRLTHRQRAIQHGVVSALAVPVVLVIRWLADIFLGWDADRDSSLAVAAGLLIGAVLFTIVSLVRGPQPSPEPDLSLTAEMSRRIR